VNIKPIEFAVEQRGLSRKDLEPFIGSRARVSEVLHARFLCSVCPSAVGMCMPA